ncbi:MAG: hypothetical protein ACK4XM_12675 [Chloroherpetonaceae bacterium]
MPSIQATLSNVYRATGARCVALQLSDVGGASGTAAKLRFRTNKNYPSPNASDARFYVVGTNDYNDTAPITVAVNAINATNPTVGVDITSFTVSSVPTNINSLVAQDALCSLFVANALAANDVTMIVELLDANDRVLDSVVIPISNASATAPKGLRVLPNEASAISAYLTSVNDIFGKLVRSQAGSIVIYPRADSAPIRLYFTEPISITPSIETRNLSAATIAQPFQFEFEFKASVLSKEYADFIYSLQRDGIIRANNVPAEPAIFEVQIQGTDFTQVIRNMSLIPQLAMDLNGGDINVDGNFIGGKFTKVMTVKELFEFQSHIGAIRMPLSLLSLAHLSSISIPHWCN